MRAQLPQGKSRKSSDEDREALKRIMSAHAAHVDLTPSGCADAAVARTELQHDAFERGRVPSVCFAGMMEYDGDLHIPGRYLVSPPSIDRTVGEFLALNGMRQVACSETQKFGHVTYFFNGNRSGTFEEQLELAELDAEEAAYSKEEAGALLNIY